MFGRDGAVNPVYDGDHMESEVGLYSHVQGGLSEDVANDEAMFNGNEATGAGTSIYDNPDSSDEATFDGGEATGPVVYDSPESISAAMPMYETADMPLDSIYDNSAAEVAIDDADEEEQAGFVSWHVHPSFHSVLTGVALQSGYMEVGDDAKAEFL